MKSLTLLSIRISLNEFNWSSSTVQEVTVLKQTSLQVFHTRLENVGIAQDERY